MSIIDLLLEIRNTEFKTKEYYVNIDFFIKSISDLCTQYQDQKGYWFSTNYNEWDSLNYYQFVYSFIQSFSTELTMEIESKRISSDEKWFLDGMKLFHFVHKTTQPLYNLLNNTIIKIIDKDDQSIIGYQEIYKYDTDFSTYLKKYNYSKYFVTIHCWYTYEIIPKYSKNLLPDEASDLSKFYPEILKVFKQVYLKNKK